MRKPISAIIERIGETDQLYLQENTAELALERADLRLQLVHYSQLHQEQIHFLQEAIVLLEQARVEFEDITLNRYLELSICLANAYMLYYEISKESKFALITQQILKPLAHYQDSDILFLLAYSSAANQQPAMTRHWLSKYSHTTEFDRLKTQQHPAFKSYHNHDWFQHILFKKIH
ncbi:MULTISPECIES: hypothetical protein [unclassified Acinetobacter]|uniref:hypothetical protein n=1 Tax=unclassified Acinetobacter TaxID=196816 RepID=UPI0029351BDB|nr:MULTISPECIES: hypothetical protein [unclassified Acinetobacter]WOE31315.1 hypothetical protein QSG84_13435 [Acinetobacter sp. SAAs470]WOE39511.1 hypothetical protein QSG86_07100 [Acinetobacter sp. SAAs474]